MSVTSGLFSKWGSKITIKALTLFHNRGQEEVRIAVTANTVYSYLSGPCSLLIISLCMFPFALVLIVLITFLLLKSTDIGQWYCFVLQEINLSLLQEYESKLKDAS